MALLQQQVSSVVAAVLAEAGHMRLLLVRELLGKAMLAALAMGLHPIMAAGVVAAQAQ